MADPRIPNPAQRSFVSPGASSTAPAVSPSAIRDVSAYAKDLDKFYPKHKFLFVTRITFSDQRYDSVVNPGRFSLLTQSTTRPKPKFDYDEVNLYGMRTGVVKKTSYDAMTMSFYDDSANEMMNFYTNVIRLQSPLTNVTANTPIEIGQYDYRFEGAQYDEPTNTFKGSPNLYGVSSGPLGKPGDNIPRLIKTIELFHVYRFGRTVNQYTFINPRIISLDLDDLSMESGTDNSLLKLVFDYDTFRLDTGIPFEQMPEISDMVGPVDYPIRRDIGKAEETAAAKQASARVAAQYATVQQTAAEKAAERSAAIRSLVIT